MVKTGFEGYHDHTCTMVFKRGQACFINDKEKDMILKGALEIFFVFAPYLVLSLMILFAGTPR